MNIIKINDFNDSSLDIYARLSEGQLKHIHEMDDKNLIDIAKENSIDNGIFIAESPIVIERALDAGYIPISMLMEEKHVESQAKTIIEKAGDIPVYVSDFDTLTKLTGFNLTRGALCAMKRKPLSSIADICNETRKIAVLEDVVNPTNVGAIFRSAAAMNVDAVLLTSKCSDPLYRRAIRVSMGNVFLIPWTIMNCENYVDELKKSGFKTAALALTKNSVSITDENLMNENRLAIILGSEGEGLCHQTIDSSDYTVRIPMTNGVDSLNVAAASAVAFWQLCGPAEN